MQKVLTEMNVQLANVISDISGLTGLVIIQAILAGERDRYKLADLANFRIQASREEIARSLEGNWRKELLFILQQELNLYQTYQQQIAECDTWRPICKPSRTRWDRAVNHLRRRQTSEPAAMPQPVLICAGSYTASAARTRLKSMASIS
jgi:transposase